MTNLIQAGQENGLLTLKEALKAESFSMSVRSYCASALWTISAVENTGPATAMLQQGVLTVGKGTFSPLFFKSSPYIAASVGVLESNG